MFDIKAIVKKCRDMNPNETYRLLTMYGAKYMSWGPEKFVCINRKGVELQKIPKFCTALKFWVNGYIHTGWVYMTVNGSDYYDAYLVNEDGTLKEKLEDMFLENVFDIMDAKIEKQRDYIK